MPNAPTRHTNYGPHFLPPTIFAPPAFTVAAFRFYAAQPPGLATYMADYPPPRISSRLRIDGNIRFLAYLMRSLFDDELCCIAFRNTATAEKCHVLPPMLAAMTFLSDGLRISVIR